MAQQRGVFRVNCIDCLDRTNVVQVSAFVGYALLVNYIVVYPPSLLLHASFYKVN